MTVVDRNNNIVTYNKGRFTSFGSFTTKPRRSRTLTPIISMIPVTVDYQDTPTAT